MRITTIEVRPLDLTLETALTVAYGSYPVLNYALLLVHTDNGLLGLGEASPDPEVTGETQAGVLEALNRLKDILVGKDPFDLEAILLECSRAAGEFPSAIAAVDMALYDLMGKSISLPVYALIGGHSRLSVPLYPVIPLDQPEVMAGMAARFHAMGAETFKIKLGSNPEEDLRRLEAITNTIGSEIRLRLDINQGWKDPRTAITAIQSLKHFRVDWVEQPVRADDLNGMAKVSAAVDVPVMADEACINLNDVFRIAESRAASMINIKLMKCGGIFQALKMLAAAESAGLSCILGSMGESSIGSAAGLHVVTARSGILACELLGPLFILNDPATGYLVDPQTYHARAGELPGLGVKLK